MYLEFGESLVGVTICYIQCIRSSMGFARNHFGEPIPGFDLTYVWIRNLAYAVIQLSGLS